MSTDAKKRGRRRWALPLLLALPFLAALIFAAVRFGPILLQLTSAAIKGTVVS
ncbi:MAG: hypothetical protein IKS46_06865 [Clostridia bacterium]|nr:hypothetical protein [Clostridia bacterium]